VASAVAKRMRRAYHHADPLVAQANLEALARELDRSHPGAASLREGRTEALTITRPGVPLHPCSNVAIHQHHRVDDRDLPRPRRNVKRWQDGQIVLRWVAAGMGEARRQFRRVNGHLDLQALRVALDQTVPAVRPGKEDAA
jgi:putative transposase